MIAMTDYLPSYTSNMKHIPNECSKLTFFKEKDHAKFKKSTISGFT